MWKGDASVFKHQSFGEQNLQTDHSNCHNRFTSSIERSLLYHNQTTQFALAPSTAAAVVAAVG